MKVARAARSHDERHRERSLIDEVERGALAAGEEASDARGKRHAGLRSGRAHAVDHAVDQHDADRTGGHAHRTGPEEPSCLVGVDPADQLAVAALPLAVDDRAGVDDAAPAGVLERAAAARAEPAAERIERVAVGAVDLRGEAGPAAR